MRCCLEEKYGTQWDDTIQCHHLFNMRSFKQTETRLKGVYGMHITQRVPSSQNLPLYPGAQVQEKLLTKSVQVEPCWQGFEAHSSMSSSHVSPVYPGSHTQLTTQHITCHSQTPYTNFWDKATTMTKLSTLPGKKTEKSLASILNVRTQVSWKKEGHETLWKHHDIQLNIPEV